MSLSVTGQAEHMLLTHDLRHT